MNGTQSQLLNHRDVFWNKVRYTVGTTMSIPHQSITLEEKKPPLTRWGHICTKRKAVKLPSVWESEKPEKILHKFSLLWTGRNKLAWCLHLLLCGHRWTDTPHPIQSPGACSFLLQTHSPGEKHEQLNKIKIQTCKKPTERTNSTSIPQDISN